MRPATDADSISGSGYREGFMRQLTIICAVLVLAASVVPAEADTRRRSDGNDTRGPLDIARIEHGHRVNAKGARQLTHTVRTYGEWRSRLLRRRAFIHLFFQLKGHPGNPEERAVWITYEDGRLQAEMYNTLGDPPKFLAKVSVWRPDERTVKIAFRKRLLRRRSFDHYGWTTLSYIEQSHRFCDRRGGCGDFAPNMRGGKRYLRHDL